MFLRIALESIWNASVIICIGVGVTIRLRVRIPVGARDFSFLQNVQTGSRANSPSWISTGVVSRRRGGGICWGVNLTTQFHVVQRLRMGGAMPVVLLCLFVAWAEETLSYYLIHALHGIISSCLGTLPWPVRIFTHFLILRAPIAFHLALRDLTWSRPNQPPIQWVPYTLSCISFHLMKK
jgi:hypothetical protein